MQMNNNNNFLTIAEAARFLSVSKTSLRRWSNDGRLPCYRLGPRSERRFREDDLLAFVAGSNDSTDMGSESVIEQCKGTAGTMPHVHLCTMFRNQDEQWHQLRPHLLAHLGVRDRIVYAYHGERPDVLERLLGEGIDFRELIEKGRLQLVSCSDCYLLESRFDVGRMLDICTDTISRYFANGTEKLLLIGEMEWYLSGLPGCEEIIKYESALDKLLQKYSHVTTICQYSLTTFPATVIYDSLCVHPYVQKSDCLISGLDTIPEPT